MTTSSLKLEIAVHSFHSAIIAEQGGAHRIELCSTLETGGLTPDAGLVELVRENLSIPMHVLIRPRIGNFCYNSFEFRTILKSIEYCHGVGVEGVVVGCLDEQSSSPPKSQIQEIRDCAGPMDVTFHRAIDLCRDRFNLLDLLEESGYQRVLTSGAAVSALKGARTIREMVEHCEKYRIQIMAGAGVHSTNIQLLQLQTGCSQFHASGKKFVPHENRDPIGLTGIFGQHVLQLIEADIEEVRNLQQRLIDLPQH